MMSIVGIYLSIRLGAGPKASRKTLGIFVAIGAMDAKGRASVGFVSTHSVVAVFVDTKGVVLLSIPNVTYGPSAEQSTDRSFGWMTWKLS
jgi:hypothetical protein